MNCSSAVTRIVCGIWTSSKTGQGCVNDICLVRNSFPTHVSSSIKKQNYSQKHLPNPKGWTVLWTCCLSGVMCLAICMRRIIARDVLNYRPRKSLRSSLASYYCNERLWRYGECASIPFLESHLPGQ